MSCGSGDSQGILSLLSTLSAHKPHCIGTWGARLRVRLSRIEVWAEKQGLELAADCHLARLSQAAALLVAPKVVPGDITVISSDCFKLNSLQLRALLEKYELEPGEPPIPLALKESIVSVSVVVVVLVVVVLVVVVPRVVVLMFVVMMVMCSVSRS
ncbi:Dilute domain [Trinorchestia longiramus]|nr:Dilute domain [Trinorchestia longiramus]